MKILLASIATRSRNDPWANPLNLYLTRIAPHVTIESRLYPTEATLTLHLESLRARTSPALILLDSRGKLLTSEDFATFLAHERNAGRQQLVFAIGPPDGWSPEIRNRADLLLSFGRMTLPHSLMRVVLAEQIYRAFTILSGHPYHTGHEG